MEKNVVHKYLRKNKKFPHIWCPGCGHGVIMSSMLRAIDKQGLDRDDVAVVSGIGCSSRTPTYVDFNTIHTTHGRALAFATGLKLAKPDMTVIVVMGDGDAVGIGGNHFIHAARRNMDLKVIVYNNNIYGMTGGQASPTTPSGKKATTARYGNIERSFDICELAKATGAVYVARSTSYHVQALEKYIHRSLSKKGFTVVEAMTHCPTTYGRLNKIKEPVAGMIYQKDHFIMKAAWDKLPEEKREGKFPMGEFVDIEKTDFVSKYLRLIEANKE
ncbi:MAG: 2-oxoglutarate ferredoxin oxidoreductase subunit beta [Candidatus Muiribacterium halophilum]|uniref:2-oxoglutarate ferredoxin oxidoreductase subunit beta n=1 Tax=Muiribacterium halophilum TaxID=2053465 RepID=A0A2N5ZGG2_MUIH1|nr:MAG: 2-oxoglutarate ferredoxin oxidoreductase subunit beta [Candidatus Muirbacterium halophilum]